MSTGAAAITCWRWGLRWFTHQPVGCATILKTKVQGRGDAAA